MVVWKVKKPGNSKSADGLRECLEHSPVQQNDHNCNSLTDVGNSSLFGKRHSLAATSVLTRFICLLL